MGLSSQVVKQFVFFAGPCERFPCGMNAKCSPTDPPQCLCLAGFKGDPQQGCVDVNECASNPCAYAARCVNEKGGYKCVCPYGMTGDPYRGGCEYRCHCQSCNVLER